MLSQGDLYGNFVINMLELQREVAKMNIIIDRDTEKVLRITQIDIEDMITTLNEELNTNFVEKLFSGFSKKNRGKKEKSLSVLMNLVNLINNHNALNTEKLRMEMDLAEKNEELDNLKEKVIIEQEENYLNDVKINGFTTIGNIVNILEVKSKVVQKDTEVMMLNEEFAKIGLLYINEIMPLGSYDVKEKAIKHLFNEIVRQCTNEAKSKIQNEKSIGEKTVLEVLSENLQYDLSMSILDSVKLEMMGWKTLIYKELFATTGWNEPFKSEGFGYDKNTDMIDAGTTSALSVIQVEVCDRMEELNRRIMKILPLSECQRKDLFLLQGSEYIKKHGFHDEYTIEDLKKYVILSKGISDVKVMVRMGKEIESQIEEQQLA
ncbi:MAG TPA: hypothetical protein DEP72_01605 [Clostridiales bacterium]|nr:MAG: hypothetical protein A2Y18_07520 [Clostridiales bacterium GWD2_32_19]HCC06849.1 hypothetical protein [Clostridiales bacterium]